MFFAVVENLVVDFIGEHDQVVLAGDLQQLAQHGRLVIGTGGVVRVDDHQCLGVLVHLGANVFQRRLPVLLFIAQVMHRGATG